MKRVRIEGSPEDVRRLLRLVKKVSAAQPGSARAFDESLARFLVATEADRERALRSGLLQEWRESIAASSGRWIARASMALGMVSIFASGFAGNPFTSFRGVDTPIETHLEGSVVGAWIVVVCAVVGAALPGGIREDRLLHVKIMFSCVAIMAPGIAAGLWRRTEYVAEVGEGLWSDWLVANLLAFGAMLVGAFVRWRRVGADLRTRVPTRDTDVEYFSATASHKEQAVTEIEALMASHAAESTLVHTAWRAGIASARRDRRISARAARRARATTAYRWRLEVVAEPDFAEHELIGSS